MYYLVIIQNDSSQAVYSYETRDVALSAFHNELAYRSESRLKTVCVILNDSGDMIKKEVYSKETANDPREPVEEV